VRDPHQGASALEPSGVAWAANWTENDTVYKAGGQNVVFHQCELANNTHDAFHANNNHDIEGTCITPTLLHGCETQDVRINDFALGSGAGRGFIIATTSIPPRIAITLTPT
jgi:hypothetical protein